MKTLEQWFDDYAVSHRNPLNKKIHYICVPAIFFSIVGLLMSIPAGLPERIWPGENRFIENWAVIALIPVLIFYIRLSWTMALKILLFSACCIIINGMISAIAPLWLIAVVIFAIAWAGQFYGHSIEGEKPSFFKDLQFLLIGPAWVFHHLFKKA